MLTASPAAASIFPEVNESAYFASDANFRLDAMGSPVALNSLLYKMCYHRFGGLRTLVSLECPKHATW